MMHDMPIYRGSMPDGYPEHRILRLDRLKDPLSCIILLADIQEEFERPKTDFKWYEDLEKNMKHVVLTYDFSCLGTDIRLNDGKLDVTYYYATDKEVGDLLTNRQNEIKEYLNLQDGYLNLSAWGITDGEGFTKTETVKKVEQDKFNGLKWV